MIAEIFATPFAHQYFDGSHPRDPALVKLLGLSPETQAGARVDQRSVLGLSPVFRAVNIIGNDVAKCKPFIYQRLGPDGRPDPQGRDKRRAMEHPAWRRTVRRANEWMSAGEVWKVLVVNAILRGNGIAHVERDEAGRVREYLPLLPDRTGMAVFGANLSEESQVEADAEIVYWTRVGREVRTILPENVVHIRGLTHNGVWGLDVIEVMRETLGLAIAARDCGAKFYGQGMLGSGILYMPPTLRGPKQEETVANFVASVKQQAQGLGRAHKLLVIEEGAKYEKLSVDPEQAQALATREFSVREIGNIIGCQPHKLGDTKRTSYASLEQSNQEHLDDDIDPWLTRLEEALEEAALSEDEKESGSHFVECNRKALMRTNLQARTSYYTAARNGGWMSANDVLRAEGEDPIGEQGDIYLVPANMTTADQAGAAFDEAPAKQASDEDEEQAARLAADYRALALHEVNRLVTRSCEEAVRKAAKGGEEFVRFVEVIDHWCYEPAPLRPLLTVVGAHLAAAFDKFTLPPYAAADLKANVAAAINEIRADALRVGGELVQPLIQPRKAA